MKGDQRIEPVRYHEICSPAFEYDTQAYISAESKTVTEVISRKSIRGVKKHIGAPEAQLEKKSEWKIRRIILMRAAELCLKSNAGPEVAFGVVGIIINNI